MKNPLFLIFLFFTLPAFADATCGNGWTVASALGTVSAVAPIAGGCYTDYEIFSGNLGNFRFTPGGTSVACQSGKHMQNGTCVNNAVGGCGSGFYDATAYAASAVHPVGGECYIEYSPQQVNRSIVYLTQSDAVVTCPVGQYATASGCVSNPTGDCPTNFVALVPNAAFGRADANDACATGYSSYGDMDFCRKYLGFNNMPDFCVPQLACPSGALAMKSSLGAVLPLYGERLTTPSLHAQIGNNVCYVNMISGTGGSGAINVYYNNQTYHLVE